MKYVVDYISSTITDEYGNKVETKVVNSYRANIDRERARCISMKQQSEAIRRMLNVYANAAGMVVKIINSKVKEATTSTAYVYADFKNQTLQYRDNSRGLKVIITPVNAAEFGIEVKYLHAFEYLTSKQEQEYKKYLKQNKVTKAECESKYDARLDDIANKYAEQFPLPNTEHMVDSDGMVWDNAADAERALLHYIMGDYEPDFRKLFS